MESARSRGFMMNLLGIILIFLKLFFIGYPFAKFLENYKNKNDSLKFTTLSPLIGSSILIFEGLLLSMNITTFKNFNFVAVGTVIFGFTYFVFFNFQNKEYIKKIKKNWLYIISYLFPIILVYLILTPSWNEKIFVRLNIDFPAYISAAKFLLGIPLNQFSSNMANHILFQAHRWGLPLISSFIKVNSTLNLYEILFSIIFIIYISSALFLKDLFGYAITKLSLNKEEYLINKNKFLFFLCLLLNSSILFFMAEGFYPQIISISILSVILGIFFLIRASVIKSSVRIFAFITLLFTGLLQTYSQAITIYLPIFLFISLLDFIRKDKEKLKIDFIFLFTILASLLIDLKIFIEIVGNQINSSSLMSGYPQPNWLFPSEILGLGSIYANSKHYFSQAFSTQLVHRSFYYLFFSILLSSGFIYLYFRYAKKHITLFVALFIFILATFSVDYILSNSGKAQFAFAYNKIAVHFSALILMFIFLSLIDISYKKYFFSSNKSIYLLSFLIILTGALTLIDLKKFQTNFNLRALMDLNLKLTNCNCILLPNERGLRQGKMIGQSRYVDRTLEGMIMEPIDVDVLDQWMPILVNSQNEGKRIFLMVFKNNQVNSNLYDHLIFQHIYENEEYLILDTKKQMKFLYGKKQDEIFNWVHSTYKSYNSSSN